MLKHIPRHHNEAVDPGLSRLSAGRPRAMLHAPADDVEGAPAHPACEAHQSGAVVITSRRLTGSDVAAPVRKSRRPGPGTLGRRRAYFETVAAAGKAST
ncbi:hypothetical protein SSP35_10_01720 [Streptomyces sp. NBRC 110611]|nr:hypothetical protein SSP35_10_01720 [Streptomyces sp. NBRC 110611]